MIEIQNLTKRYGEKTVLNNVSFSVKKGEIVGFLGPNGAGKTTTMNILTGYISSNEGIVTVDGFDVLQSPFEVKKRIGYLPEQPPLYLDMTVMEYLNFVYELKRVSGDRESHILEILEKIHIQDVSGRLIKNLSKGYRQRVGLAQALIGNPEVLILDEPTVGLDPKQMIEIRNLICELGKEHTVILSSHILSEISAICERVIILNRGNIVAVDTPQNLSERMIGSCYRITVKGDQEEVLSVLKNTDGVLNAKEIESGEYRVELVNGMNDSQILEELFYRLAEHKMPILQEKPEEISLEDIFLHLTSEETNHEMEETA
ncbi:MAG: ABC transporter ATP-binding protein [Ruminococcaceae bacterium]|nr:ABC transporter ATP-binding protein [Oscillospiraceae bacterium]